MNTTQCETFEDYLDAAKQDHAKQQSLDMQANYLCLT